VKNPQRLDKAGIERLKSSLSVLDVARDLGLRVEHHRFRCPNPERHSHGDRTPSVTLWPERGFFKCWVCPDMKGDVIDLVRHVKGLGFSEAVAYLQNRGGFSPLPGGQAEDLKHPRATPQSQTELLGFPVSTAGENRAPAWGTEAESLRRECLEALLELCPKVGGKASAWLRKRRIFKKTWDAQGLRVVANYGQTGQALAARFSLEQLRESGLFNAEGHLRFYRHALLLPYFDAEGRPAYLQARALESETKPKELSLAGPVPGPYNARLLDGKPGHLYLCEGVIDTLTLLEAGFQAVGVPGAANFKPGWASLFRGKSVYVAFDADAAGEAGAAKAMAMLAAEGVQVHRLEVPAGKDINEWLVGKK
jgi:DNA primase